MPHVSQETPRMLLASTRIARLAQHRLAALKEPLTPRQWRLLLRIREGHDSAAGLRRLMGLTAATMSQSIGTLHRRGLIVRSPSQQDGRGAVLSLTTLGEEALTDAVAANDGLVTELRARLPEHLHAAADEIFATLSDVAAEMLGRPHDPPPGGTEVAQMGAAERNRDHSDES